jgi:osmoprotectant transport system ATP-binding protein
MTTITFDKVTKEYAGASHPAIDAVSFEVSGGTDSSSICMLLGTSGSGKTTLLRMVNRLIEPTSGRILIDEQNILEENPILLRRRIGYVIQQAGLFPHMNIAENIRITAEIADWSRQRMSERVDELLTLVGLEPNEYRRRFPRQLSGGQQQRVGLARALATDPDILLMDEPFGALDAITRERMQEELLRIRRTMRKTILFVTHDVEEAFRLGDRIAILSEGKLVQLGTPIDLLANPANAFVRKLVGSDNMLRQLQYLPVSTALDQEQGQAATVNIPTVQASATLLQAMLVLIETNSHELAVYDEDTGEQLGYITLTSINREISRFRRAETEQEEATRI